MTTPACPSCPSTAHPSARDTPFPWLPQHLGYSLHPKPVISSPSNTRALTSQLFLQSDYQGHPHAPNPGLPQASSLGLTCRQKDAPHTALAETKLLKNVVKMG